LGGPGVDRDHAVAGRDERQVAEVVALGDLDTGFRAQDPGRGEAEPVGGGHPEASEHQLGVCRGRAEPRLTFGLGGLIIVAQHGIVPERRGCAIGITRRSCLGSGDCQQDFEESVALVNLLPGCQRLSRRNRSSGPSRFGDAGEADGDLLDGGDRRGR
jgi:hypothetical protein